MFFGVLFSIFCVNNLLKNNGAGKRFMDSISCFGAVYLLQQSLSTNLSNAVVTNHAKVHITVTSKNYGIQNYAHVQDQVILKNIPTPHRDNFKVSNKTLGKGGNLV